MPLALPPLSATSSSGVAASSGTLSTMKAKPGESNPSTSMQVVRICGDYAPECDHPACLAQLADLAERVAQMFVTSEISSSDFSNTSSSPSDANLMHSTSGLSDNNHHWTCLERLGERIAKLDASLLHRDNQWQDGAQEPIRQMSICSVDIYDALQSDDEPSTEGHEMNTADRSHSIASVDILAALLAEDD